LKEKVRQRLRLTICLIFVGVGTLYSQTTPVTQYPCDPRSTANGGVCPADCNFAPTIERGCNCFDSVDNDGDGKRDASDPDCAQYFGLEFVGEGSDCSITPPGANTPYDLVGNPSTSAQNTADTQAKVAVGDVDGDGIPDAVITSKWNREVRVVATSDNQADGSDAGDIKADFKTTGAGAGYFAGGNKLLFEHEVLIADIDKDGKAEIFAVVSNRGGNPSTPPTGFYLIGFRYTAGAGGLIPLYNAIDLGSNRPGTFGIADMDGDGKAEVYLRDRIFAAETGKLLASEGGKTMSNTGLWDVNVTSAPVAIDIKAAGADNFKMELVVGNRIYTIPSLTNRNPASPGSLILWKDMNTLSFDVNADGANDQYFVKLMNDPVEYGVDTHSSVSVADVDKDGEVDVILSGALNSATGRSTVFYWNVKNNTVSGFMTETSAQLGIPPAQSPDYNNYLNGWIWGTGRVNIGDVNGDGTLDLIFIAGNRLYAKTISGNSIVDLWPKSRTINDSRSGVLTVTIYDFDNDGAPELVYRDSQELVIVDGATGWNNALAPELSRSCQSHTYTEGPIIADVNGDGGTDICVTCNTNNAFDITDPIQQQALGQIRLYFSSGNEWLPTRKVWNQPGYFVVNINDDLTLPFPQFDISTSFPGNCSVGPPGERRPFNVFLNQVPFLSATGCPVYPAPDLTFIGDDPNDPLADPTDPDYFPTVFVKPPICGNLDIDVGFNVTNSGDLPITTTIPISFFNGSPYDVNNPGTLLYSTTINVNNLQVGDTLSIGDYVNSLGQVKPGDLPFIEFDGPGSTFELYVVLYNDGSVLPIDTTTVQSAAECDITNNYWPITVVPTPFTVNIDSVSNVKCLATSPDTGELISHIQVGADTVIDLSPYAFQWYQSDGVTPIAGATNYNLTGISHGDYYLVITNLEKGCSTAPILGQVDSTRLVIPGLVLVKLADQTSCTPPNGVLEAQIPGGTAGFEFHWELGGAPLANVGPVLNNAVSGTYLVTVEETSSGCSTFDEETVFDLIAEPDIVTSATPVINCVNAASGSVFAAAVVGGVVQDSVNYTFDWYVYDKATETRGSLLPTSNGNPTVKGLPAGYYEVFVTDLATGCNDANVLIPDTIQVTDQTVLPEALITELAPQTSCDPTLPNGRLQADAVINGVVQNPADFTFEWFEGQNTVTPHAGGTSGVNGQIAENVKGGGQAYTVRITTVNQCSVTKDTVVTEVIVYPQVSLTTTPNSVCDQALGFTGSVNSVVTFDGANITAGDPNYTFTWYNGSVADPADERAADLNKQNITQLDSGFYTLVVENTLLHCPSIASVEQVLSIKALPVITADADSSTNCQPIVSGNGSVQVTDVDGAGITADYTFEWHRGTDIAGVLIASVAASPDTLQGASGNFYTVLVRNSISGCENTETVEVTDASVLPLFTLAPLPNTVCDPSLIVPAGAAYTGSVTATLTNATAGNNYTFAWTDLTPEIGDPLIGTTGPVITQRDSSTYRAIVTHVETGCVSDPVTAVVGETTSTPVIDAVGVPSTNCDPALPNGAAQVVDVDAGGGIGTPYAFEWFRGSDVSGSLVATAAATPDTLQGATGNFYTVRVTNQNDGCRDVYTVEVSDDSVLPLFTLTPQPNTICDPSLVVPAGATFTGTVTAVLTNEVAGDTYTVAWSDVTPEAGDPPIATNGLVITQRDSSLYQAIITHVETGCVSDPLTAFVDEVTTQPVIDASASPSTNCDPALPNGIVQVTDVDNGGGIGSPYDFEWYRNVTASGTLIASTAVSPDTLQGAPGNFYTVLVTNQNDGCQNVHTVEVADARVLPLLSMTSTPTTICDKSLGPDGTATATVTNPVAGDTYTFAWVDLTPDVGDPLIADTDGVITNRDSSAYQAVVTHVETGCLSDPGLIDILTDFFVPPINIADVPNTSCVLPGNGSLAATIDETTIGGNAAENAAALYSFVWSDNDDPFTAPGTTVTTTTATNGEVDQLPGNQFYTVLTTRLSTGCTNTRTIYLQKILTYPVVSLTVDNQQTACAPPDGQITATVNAVPVQTYTFYWLKEAAFTFTSDTAALIAAVDASTALPNRKNTGGAGVDTDIHTGLTYGDYTMLVRDNFTQCISLPVQATILDQTLSQITINANGIPTTCNTSNGSLDISAMRLDGQNTTFDFELYLGGPVNATMPITFPDNPPVFNATLNAAPTWPKTATYTSPTPPNAVANIGALGSFVYTVVATDGFGCQTYDTYFLPFSDAHAMDTDLLPSTICSVPPGSAGNGEISVAAIPPVTGPFTAANTNQSWFTYTFYQGGIPDPANIITPPSPFNYAPAKTTEVCGNGVDNDGDGLNDATDPDCIGRVDITTLAPGFYTVEIREDYTADRCPVYEVIEITQDALNPVVSFVGALKANTACDITAAADGEVSIEVTKHPNDLTTGFTYKMDVFETVSGDNPVTWDPTDPGVDVGPYGPFPPVGLPLAKTIDGLRPDLEYTIEVTSSNNCVTTRTFSIPNQPQVSELVDGDISITDADLCFNSGQVVVNAIDVIGGTGADPDFTSLGNYEFAWFDDTGLTNEIWKEQGNAAPDPGQLLDPTTYASMGAGSYWVVARKTMGTNGIGCLSAPFRADVDDVSVKPVLDFNPYANTACTSNVAFMEGSIAVRAADPSGPGVGALFTYEYAFDDGTNPPITVGPLAGNNGNGMSDGDLDSLTNLGDGVYQFTVTNETTGCQQTGQVTILKTTVPIIIAGVEAKDRFFCLPSGQAIVTDVQVAGATEPNTNFDFAWYEGSLTTPLGGVAANVSQLDSISYPAITVNSLTYFVEVTKQLVAGAPGAGCKSAPARIDIKDLSVDPVIALTPFANTSCTLLVAEGSIKVEAADSGGPGAGSLYTYNYTFNDGTNPPVNVGPLAGNNGNGLPDADMDSLTNLATGVYQFTVLNETTQCLTAGQATIRQTTVPVVIARVSAMDRFFCQPSGQAIVNEVQVGGSTESNANFDFTWYEGDLTTTLGVPAATTQLDSMSYPNITVNSLTYFVEVTKRIAAGAPGAGCKSVPARIDIRDRSVDPVISLAPYSNTSCSTLTFDGSIAIEAADPGGPGVGQFYTYNYVYNDGVNPPTTAGPFTGNNGNGVADGDLDSLINLGPGSYQLEVINETTLCRTTGTTTIRQTTIPIIITDLIALDKFFCVPSGQAIVNEVQVGGSVEPNTNFDFTWYENDLTNMLGGVAASTDQLDSISYPNITVNSFTYWVEATKQVAAGAPGAGCKSAPARVDIKDLHVNPIPSLQSFANSSCTAAFLNGSIVLLVSDSRGPGVGQLYTYLYDDGVNPPVTLVGNNGNQINDGAGPDADSITNLGTGVYAFTITNETTGCSTPASIEITYDPVASQPNIINIDTTLPTDCLGNGGTAAVTEIRIGAGPAITGSPALDPPNFVYDWYDNQADAFAVPTVPGNVPNGAPTNGRFQNMLASGTYFVKVRDLLTDCISKPVEVPIDDVDVVYPQVAIRQTSLQLSCDVLLGTASLKALADGQDDSNADYFFTWYNNLTADDPAYSDPVVSTDSIGNLVAGNYSVKVLKNSTGCESELFFVVPELDPIFLPSLSISGGERTSCVTVNGSVAVSVLPFPTAANGLTYPFNPTDFKVDLYVGDQTGAGLDQEPPALAPDQADLAKLPATYPGNYLVQTLDIGTYTIRLRDNNTGCIVVEKTDVLDDRQAPVPTVVPENPLTNCDTRFNGQLSVTADGRPVGDYDYYWWSENTNPPTAVGDTLSTQHKLIGVNQGLYFVNVVSKASGCETLASGRVEVGQVFPPTPTIDVIRPQTICWENFYPADPAARPNGWLAAHVNNETLGYRFDWFTGDLNTVQGLTPDTTGVNYLHLAGGFYTVNAVILQTGCASLASEEVPDERIIPQGIIESTPSYCPDVSPTFTGTGSVVLQLTNREPVTVRNVDWFIDGTNTLVGNGVQVFELSPGFYRAEMITSEYCENTAVGEVKTEILAYNLVSANGDSNNDTWIIDCITNFPNNNVKVFNRYGVKVFEINGYDNQDNVFKGLGERGLYSMGNDLPDGTYFYIIDKRDGSKPIRGFLELVR
jgi:gliding motility-associated-like protein